MMGVYSTYPDVTYRHVTVETLMHIVAIGEGITLVSEGWTSMTHADLALRPLTALEDIVPFSAVSSPASDNPAQRRFVSFAQNWQRGGVCAGVSDRSGW